jgi:predicted GIY-YIG superfamily endonuclease
MVYLIHFDKPYKHAQHYIGFTDNLDARLDRHHGKHGSKLLKAVEAAGISFKVVRTWDGDRAFERKLKNRKNASRYCPICRAAVKRKG